MSAMYVPFTHAEYDIIPRPCLGEKFVLDVGLPCCQKFRGYGSKNCSALCVVLNRGLVPKNSQPYEIHPVFPNYSRRTSAGSVHSLDLANVEILRILGRRVHKT